MAKLLKIQAMQDMSDEDLLQEFKNSGNQDVLANLFMRYTDLLYGVCMKYLENAEEARDAVMNIYQELLVKLPKHEVQQFRGWVYVLARNHCLMQLRSAKKNITVSLEQQVVQSGELSHLDDIIEKENEFKKLEQCIEGLSAEQATGIRLFYYENKCYNEIAEATGMEWNKVRSLIQNGRRNLKICMERNGQGAVI